MKARPVGRSEKAQLLKRSLGYPAQHVCTNETPIEQYEWGVNQGEMEEIGVIGGGSDGTPLGSKLHQYQFNFD